MREPTEAQVARAMALQAGASELIEAAREGCPEGVPEALIVSECIIQAFAAAVNSDKIVGHVDRMACAAMTVRSLANIIAHMNGEDEFRTLGTLLVAASRAPAVSQAMDLPNK